MKGIFSKTGNKKDISGKMERRGTGNQIVSSPGQPHHGNGPIPVPHAQQNGRGNSSFIPTSATYHSHSNGHPGKQISSSSGMQNHAHNSNVALQHPNNFYSNPPGSHNNTTITTGGTMGNRQEHHYTNYQQTIHHSQQQYTSQQMHQRTLTKSYSSHNNQQSHYGNTTGHANNSANHNTYYGNTTNLTNGTVIMNGHHGGEKSVINSHTIMNPVQQTYNHQQVHSHQQMQQMQQLQVQGNRNQHQHPQVQQYHHQQQQQQQSTNQNNINPNSTEGLPHTLVDSMRTLFDILDDTKQGKIRLSDIETRWESDTNGNNGKNSGAEPLIKMGVLEYLRKVTPPDGMLTFDKFCSGLRLALLTNNNDSPDESSPLQIEKVHHHNPPPPQQYFQEHVKNMTNSAKTSQNGPPPPQSNYNNTNNNNHHHLANKSNSASQLPNTGQNNSNSIQRMSRIPNLSTSRLPMPNSGIPVSPNNRLNAPFSPTAGSNIPNMSSKTTPTINQNGTHSKRFPTTTTEQGTTVALVHPQPPPNPKPVTGGIPSYMNGGTLKMTKQISTPGLQNRFSSRNSSMDDLKAPNHNNNEQFGLPQKERPPSAPILDNDADDNLENNNSYNQSNNKQRLRERAKSQERDRASNATNNNISRADEKSNFVKSRQRTLSMPQLQLKKLQNSKSAVVNFDDSSPEKIIPPPSVENNYPRPSALKNSGHSHSKLTPAPSSVSAIPVMPSTNSLRHTKKEILSTSLNQKELEHDRNELDLGNDFPPPPPKPPRGQGGQGHSMNGPVTISTTLVNGVTQDPPLSGSSFGSGQTQSSSVTISLSASSSGGNSSKPEIRNVLHTWQKSMTDKKPVEASLSVTSIATTSSSVNTNDTTKSAPPSAAVPAMVNGEKANQGNIPNLTTSDDVKLRATKSNLRRKETARRHTVQSGIDFSTLKRLKQLEQERDVLQQGISYLEKASEWYAKQLETADDKIGLLTKGSPTADYWSESHEERLNLLGCRISEVNSLLTALMDGSSRLPLHMNLQIPSHLSLRTITRLKDQNRQLTHEVSDYSHRVTQLENEKAMLLRQLFHQKNNSTSDETVYM